MMEKDQLTCGANGVCGGGGGGGGGRTLGVQSDKALLAYFWVV